MNREIQKERRASETRQTVRIENALLLARKTMPGAGKYLTLLLAALSFFLLFSGLRIGRSIRAEQALPCEITAAAEQTGISSSMLSLAGQIPGVEAVSLTDTMEAALRYEDYQAAVLLRSLDSAVLEGEWLCGSAYPDETAMPYLVLNEAALSAFRNAKKAKLEAPEQLAWTELELTLQSGNDHETVLRVSGVLHDGAEDARAYLSTAQLRKLKSEAGMETAEGQLWLRIANAGARADVVHALSDLSLTADENDDRQEEWNRQEERRNLYLGTGAAVLLAAGGMMAAQEKYRRARLHSACELLDMEGIPDPGLRRIARLRWGILTFASLLLGAAGAVIYQWITA